MLTEVMSVPSAPIGTLIPVLGEKSSVKLSLPHGIPATPWKLVRAPPPMTSWRPPSTAVPVATSSTIPSNRPVRGNAHMSIVEGSPVVLSMRDPAAMRAPPPLVTRTRMRWLLPVGGKKFWRTRSNWRTSQGPSGAQALFCLLYTSDAADEEDSVALG